jgi:hypothetical protein
MSFRNIKRLIWFKTRREMSFRWAAAIKGCQQTLETQGERYTQQNRFLTCIDHRRSIRLLTRMIKSRQPQKRTPKFTSKTKLTTWNWCSKRISLSFTKNSRTNKLAKSTVQLSNLRGKRYQTGAITRFRTQTIALPPRQARWAMQAILKGSAKRESTYINWPVKCKFKRKVTLTTFKEQRMDLEIARSRAKKVQQELQDRISSLNQSKTIQWFYLLRVVQSILWSRIESASCLWQWRRRLTLIRKSNAQLSSKIFKLKGQA